MLDETKDLEIISSYDEIMVKRKEKHTQADALVELVKDTMFFCDDMNEPYALISFGNHKEIWPVKSKNFKRWISKMAWDKLGKVPNSEALRSAINLMEAMAVFQGAKYKLYNRVAEYQGAIWYDMANPLWQVIKITPNGWYIVNDPPILFRRYSHQVEQPMPAKNGDISHMLKFVNLKTNVKLLFMVYVITCFVPNIPHPVLVLHGEKGAAKTTTMKLLKKLIDPSAVETLSFPHDISELVQKLAHHWYAGFDNISHLPDWISDALCKAVTGDGFSKRQLYTDDDDVIYNFRRCIAINGINVVATREDLLDRSILIELERIPPEMRKEEIALWTAFEKAKPYILGGIFTTLAKAINIYPTVTLNKLNRMADFTRWGYAVAEALGHDGREFLEQYGKNIAQQNEEAINANPVASAVVAFMSDRTEWEGKPSELLQWLEAAAIREKIDTHTKAWPKAAHILTRRLNQIKSNLLEAGIAYTYEGHTETGSRISLRHMKK